jgi:hypothetical protein
MWTLADVMSGLQLRAAKVQLKLPIVSLQEMASALRPHLGTVRVSEPGGRLETGLSAKGHR